MMSINSSFKNSKSKSKAHRDDGEVATKGLVRQMINSFAETKNQVYSRNVAITSYNGTNFVANQINAISPYSTNALTIVQGTGQGDRIGNQIRTVRLRLRFAMYPNPQDATVNTNTLPQEVMLYILMRKSASNITPTSLNDFYTNGNSSAAPTSSLFDCISDVNKDVYTVKAIKRYKLGFALNAGTGIVPTAQSFSNNDYKYNVVETLDVTQWAPKLVQYSDGVTTPTNNLLFFVVMTVPSNGSVNAASQLPVQMLYNIEYYYRDE